jgi:hypothetical protein
MTTDARTRLLVMVRRALRSRTAPSARLLISYRPIPTIFFRGLRAGYADTRTDPRSSPAAIALPGLTLTDNVFRAKAVT